MGETEFDHVLLASIDKCMATFDLKSMQDAEWAGYVEYGSAGKNWGKFEGEGEFREFDVRIGEDGVTVYESCNFASNSAYYQSLA